MTEGRRETVEERSVKFLQLRHLARASGGGWDGEFCSTTRGKYVDLFGSLDAVYILAIIGRLHSLTTPASRTAWQQVIRSFQSEDGWFHAGDAQRHGRVHATAYALGGLALLDEAGAQSSYSELAALRVDPQLEARYLRSWYTLSLVERLHFWRGSHQVAGLAAIVGQLRDAGYESKFSSTTDPNEWLALWSQQAMSSVDEGCGLWLLAPTWARTGFDSLYRLRHSPDYGYIGGAAHIYWILEKLGLQFPQGERLARWILDRTSTNEICEKEPYCLDFDRNFLLARGMSGSAGTPIYADVCQFLDETRGAILSFYSTRDVESWNPNSHKLPGALAAVAEVDRILTDQSRLDRGWRDVFETVWWL